MKVIMINSGAFNPNTGGGIHILELFKNLSIRNEVICLTALSNNFPNTNNGFIKIPFINMKMFRSVSFNFSLFFFLIYYCRNFKPDLLYVRNYGMNYSTILISNIMRIPYVLEVNGLLIDDNNSIKGKNKSQYNKIQRISDLITYVNSSKIIAVTNGIKRCIIEDYSIPEEKIVVIENGANIDRFIPYERKTACELVGLDPLKKYVCFVGGLAPWHGLNYLFDAVPTIIEREKDTIFLIIGDGPMRQSLMKQVDDMKISQHVKFYGQVEHELVPFFICASDVCVAPFTEDRNSRIGISPLKIYEYLACERQVIVSKIAGAYEIIEHTKAGIVSEVINPCCFGNDIIKLLTNPIGEQILKDARKYVIGNYTWKSTSEKTICELTQICSSTI